MKLSRRRLGTVGNGRPRIATRISNTQPSNLLIYLPLNELNGTVARNNALGRAGINICPNPLFKRLGGGGADVFLNWTEAISTGAIAQETVDVPTGSYAAKITAGTSTTMMISLQVVIPGHSYTFSFLTHGDGTHDGRYWIYDNSNASMIKDYTTTGVTGLTYAQVSYTFTAPAGCVSVQLGFRGSSTIGGIFYVGSVSFVDNTTDPTIFDGTYSGDVTLARSGYSGLSAGFGGTNGKVDLSRSALVNYFPTLAAAGSYIIYGKTTIAALTDSLSRWLIKFKTITSTYNFIDCFEDSSNNKLGWQFKDDASGQIYRTSAWTTENWFSVGATWSVANSVRCYVNGLVVASGAGWTGAWTDQMNLSNMCLSSPDGYWIGNMQNFAMWDVELTAAEMANVGKK